MQPTKRTQQLLGMAKDSTRVKQRNSLHVQPAAGGFTAPGLGVTRRGLVLFSNTDLKMIAGDEERRAVRRYARQSEARWAF